MRVYSGRCEMEDCGRLATAYNEMGMECCYICIQETRQYPPLHADFKDTVETAYDSETGREGTANELFKQVQGGGWVTVHDGGYKQESSWGGWGYHGCDHHQDPVTLTDGTILYATAKWDLAFHRSERFMPDLGVYLESAWLPDTIAFHIGWPDYGLPMPSIPNVLTIASTALSAAQAGKLVEIGCMGAHGRTGTFLAICEMLTHPKSPKPDVSVRHVQTAHCHKAVETKTQQHYVREVARFMKANPQ